MPRTTLAAYDEGQRSGGEYSGPLGALANVLTRPAVPKPEYGQMQPGLAEIGAGGGITGAALRSMNPMMFDENSAFAKWTRKPVGSPMGEAATEVLEGPVAGTFGGVNAKTADLYKLATARDMMTRGADNEAVRQATGWFKGMDGKWRFEIPDNSFSVVRDAVPASIGERSGIKSWSASDALSHNDLFTAYPELGGLKIGVYGESLPSGGGSYAGGRIDFGNVIPNSLHGTSAEQKETLLHELQHAIQEREGFSLGGSPFAQNAARGTMDPEKFAEYRRLAGEIEARDVAKRMGMTPEQRLATPPNLRRDAILRMNHPGMSFSSPRGGR